jgi:PKD domain
MTGPRQQRGATGAVPNGVGFLLMLALAIAAALALSGNAAAETGIQCPPTGLETVATDKADYPPGETVHVTGAGYGPVCDVEVRIERPDGIVESFVSSTDVAGGFALDYVLPGPPGVIGEYRITVRGLGGATVASMTFTDAAGAVEVAPAHYPAPSPSTQQRDFTVLGRVLSALGNGAKCVRLTLPSGFAIVSGSQSFEVGAGSGWSLALNNVGGTPRQLLLTTSAPGNTGLPSSGTGNWARFDFKATTPAGHTSPAWDLTFADNGSCSMNPNTVQAGVRIANQNNQTYTADFRDAGGNVVSPSVAPGGPAQTFRLRIANTSGGSGDKLAYAGFALPKCFANPTGVSVTTSNGSRPNFSLELRDRFIRLSGGELEKDQTPDDYVEVTFTSSATSSCSTSTHSFWTSAWKSAQTSASAPDNFNITGSHPAVTVAPANTAPSVAADSATVTVNEGQTALASGTWSDPDADQTVTLTASVGAVTKNADGTWSWSYGTSDGPAQSQTVTITATDNASTPASSSTTFALSVDNVAPSATFDVPPSVTEGSTIDVSLISPSDPSSVDTAAGFEYRFSCDNGTTWTAWGSAASHGCPTDDDGARVVKGELREKDGGVSSYSASVTVTNAAPSATFDAPAAVDEGSGIDVSLSGVVDPGSADTHQYRFKCGDEDWTSYGDSASHGCATSDDSTVVVLGQVRDDDGGESAEYSASVTVNNVAPAATFTAPGSVDEGSSIDVSLGDLVDPGSADTHEYRFSCDGGATWTAWSPVSSHPCPTTDDGTSEVRGQVRDDDGGESDVYSAAVTVENVAPEAMFANDGPVDEGSDLNLSLTDVVDPGSADTHEFRFSCDGGTTWTDWSSTASHGCSTDDNGTRSVKGQVRDDDGGESAEYAASATVENVAPSATFSAPEAVDEGSSIDLSLGDVVDPGSADTHEFRFSCDGGSTWSDWSSTASHSCPTADNGMKSVQGQVRDDDGGTSDVYADTVAVDNVAPSATFNAPESVNEGSDISLSLTDPSDPSSADTTAGFEYRFSCDGGDVWTAWSSSSTASCPTEDDGVRSVKGEIGDKDADASTYSASVAVENVAPSATFTAPEAVDEGSSIDLSLGDVVDPGSADAHEFRFSCDGGTTWSPWSSTAGYACATTDDGTVEVRGQVRDDDGGMSDVYSDSVTVENVAPSATFDAPESIDEGSDIDLALTSVVDPGSADTHEFRFSCDGGATWTGWSTTASHSCSTDDDGTKSVYGQVRDDDGGVSEAYSASVTVDNVAPSATFNAPESVNEGSNVSISLTDPSDPSSVDTAAGFQYRFSCDGGGTWTPWSSSTTHVCSTDDNGTKNVDGEIRDKDSGASAYSASVTVDNVAPAATFGAPTSVNEGSGINLSLTTPSDPSSADTAAGFQYAFDCGDGSGYGAYSSSSTQSCPTSDNGTRSVGGKIKDKDGGASEYTATVTVDNVAPTLTSLTPSSYLVLKGTPLGVTGSYTDPGTGDTFACTINFDEPTGTPENVAGGPGSCSATQTYAAQGTYTVSMKVSDDDGGESNTLTVIVTVYDPGAGGFVTGGGWINSPVGSYAADPTASGRANFGFNSQYKKGAGVPTGETEFQLHFASFNFHSDAYEVLVVSGHKAQYRGTGRVNGVPGHRFVLTAYDGQISGGGGGDRFRIKITRISDNVVVYDTKMGTSDDMDLADPLAIGGGSIVIHKAK